MNKSLLDFHRGCKEEYETILTHFNLLFYGYGNKEDILLELFPNAHIFNMRFCSVDSILEEASESLMKNKRAKTIQELDLYLKSKHKKALFIILNFDFNLRMFENLESISLIGTIEIIDIDFDQNDILKFRFILRDLTTFEDYTDDITNSEIVNNKVQNVKLIFGNLSNKPKIVFLKLLELGSCPLNTLFDSIKTLLFLSKIQTLLDLLREFVDHKIIKISNGNNRITLNLNESERKNLMEILNKETN